MPLTTREQRVRVADLLEIPSVLSDGRAPILSAKNRHSALRSRVTL